MALTAAQQRSIVALTVGMFDAAPGVHYANEFADYVAWIQVVDPTADPIRSLADQLSQTVAFNSAAFFPNSLTNQQFAARFIDQLVGDTVPSADKAWAVNWMLGQLNAGATRGDAIYQVVKALDAVPSTDPVWGDAAKMLDNKIVVAEYYTFDFGGTALDVDTLQSVVADVDQDTDVSPAALPGIIDAAVGEQFVLTANPTAVDEGNSVTFHLQTANVAAGTTLSYVLSGTGINAADFALGAAAMSGTVTTDATGQAVVSVALKADQVTEGAETLTMTLASPRGNVTASTTVNDTSETPVGTFLLTAAPTATNEGTTVVFTLETENVPVGSTFAYTLSGTGITAEDIVGGVAALSGSATIGSDGKAVVSVELVNDNLTEGTETLIMTVAGQTAQVEINDTSVTPPPTPQTLILTPAADVLYGGSVDDTFVATQSTLTLGDSLFGGEGTDTLTVSLTGSAALLTGFATDSVEVIQVKSLATGDSALDMSDVEGPITIRSYETDGAELSFRDIQSVNDTKIEIIDTDEDHSFSYDLNAYDPTGLDTVDLTLQEIREFDRGRRTDPDIEFTNRDGSRSNVDVVNLHSLERPGAGPTPATDNYVDSLRVGADFDTLIIDGGSDVTTDRGGNLVIEDALDENIRVINAGALAADLTLTVDHTDKTAVWAGRPNGELFEYTGAQGNDDFDLTRVGNSIINLNTGDDSLSVQGDGNLTVIGGLGNDSVTIVANDDNIDDGRHIIDLGAGNDFLSITGDVNFFDQSEIVPPLSNPNRGGVTTIIAGNGNDTIEVLGNGSYLADLGEGNDRFTKTGTGNNTISAGDGDDTVTIDADTGSTSNVVDLGIGRDTLTITGNGAQSITAGDGDDTITVNGNGPVTATGDDGNDRITINGTGVHNIDLGSGDDYLLINGARRDANNIDNTPPEAQTSINGGDGNDTVDVRGDHWLLADLGAGDDQITLRAEHLTTDDAIAGGAGRDTLILTNDGEDPIGATPGQDSDASVLVDESDTDSVTGIEVFNLRDQNIRLELTPDNFDTAEQRSITVTTRESLQNQFDLPQNVQNAGISNGMTAAAYQAVADSFGWTGDQLTDWVLRQGVPTVEFGDMTGDGDSQTITTQGVVTNGFRVEAADGETVRFNVNDQVYFPVNTDAYQQVDITAVPLSLNSGRSFTLLGGTIRDIVVADADSINGRSILEFDNPGALNSTEDTLRVIGGATITAADLRNVTGLEIIELQAPDNTAVRWEIELNDRVINQTTGVATLFIKVDPEVAAGSELFVYLDPSVHNGSANDVQIQTNSNVRVYITDPFNGLFQHLVTEDEFGVRDFDTDLYVINVLNQLLFTTNADNLQGTEGDDIFIAQTLDQVQAGDLADGRGHVNGDTAIFNFAVANGTATLEQQFSFAEIRNIERFEFDTERSVRMDGIGLGYNTALRELATGSASDVLTSMRKGIAYELNGGNDSITLLNFAPNNTARTTVDGGLGNDSVFGTTAQDHVSVRNVEFIDLFTNPRDQGQGDSVTLLAANPELVTIWNAETITGSSGADNVYADTNGTNAWDSTIWIDGRGGDDTLNVGTNTPTNVTAYGGTGADIVNVLARDSALVYGDDNDGDTRDDGNDTINVTVTNGDATVYGEGGNDSINVRTEDDAEVYGGAGNDTITVHSDTNNGGDGDAIVYGDDGDDLINVTVASGGASSESTNSDATVDGGSGNDTINVSVSDDASVRGGEGNDSITVIADNDAGGLGSVIFGDNGNDTIAIGGDAPFTITGGRGNDEINLQDFGPGASYVSAQDTIVFGNVTYNAAQTVDNANGLDEINNFNFERFASGGDPNPAPTDVLDFSVFLGSPGAPRFIQTTDYNGAWPGLGTGLAVKYGDWTTGSDKDDVSMYNNIVFRVRDSDIAVIAADDDFVLTGANIRQIDIDGPRVDETVRIGNNSQAVVIIAKDAGGLVGGYDTFDVYFVQDVDSGAGSTWAVDQVATINSLTEIGAINDSSIGTFLFA